MLLPAATVSMISELPLHNPALLSRPSLSLLRRRFRLFSAAAVRAAVARRNPGSDDCPLEDDSPGEIARFGADRRRSSGLLRSNSASAPWLQHWTPRSPTDESAPEQEHAAEEIRDAHGRSGAGGDGGSGGISSIERIVWRLHSFGSRTADADKEGIVPEQRPLNGDERLGDLLERSWDRLGAPSVEDPPPEGLLPWERKRGDCRPPAHSTVAKERRVKAPTLAELTVEDTELRRLRRLGRH